MRLVRTRLSGSRLTRARRGDTRVARRNDWHEPRGGDDAVAGAGEATGGCRAELLAFDQAGCHQAAQRRAGDLSREPKGLSELCGADVHQRRDAVARAGPGHQLLQHHPGARPEAAAKLPTSAGHHHLAWVVLAHRAV